jgi:hypothetical protein
MLLLRKFNLFTKGLIMTLRHFLDHNTSTPEDLQKAASAITDEAQRTLPNLGLLAMMRDRYHYSLGARETALAFMAILPPEVLDAEMPQGQETLFIAMVIAKTCLDQVISA